MADHPNATARLDSLQPSPTLATQAFDALKTAILDGAWRPGEELTERAAAEQLGVSTTPVREALRRLEEIGLLERRSSKSLVVSSLLETPRAEFIQIEASLRGVAARLAAEKITGEERERLRSVLQRLDNATKAGNLGEILTASRDCHDVIHRASKNSLLIRWLSTTYLLRRHLAINKPAERMQDEDLLVRFRQHFDMAEAVLDGNAPLAEQLARDHTLSSGMQ